MPVVKVQDIAFGRLRAPDLDAMEEFLTDFGMIRSARTDRALYMRGTGSSHHIHVTEKGEPGFIGFAFQAVSLNDLKKLAKLPGASGVETINEPGGGKRVRLREPNGYQIEVVYGIKKLKPIKVKRQKINSVDAPLARAGTLMRPAIGPSRPHRIGHGVMGTPKLKETVAWFRDTLGLICSDDVYAGSKDNLIGSFNRCDRGKTYVDHHTFFCLHYPKAGLNHLSYEVQDIDDVFIGHEYMRARGKYEHMWGIGRHVLGSQVYDYWADPWGRVHEHWADTDRLNTKTRATLLSADEALRSQWGEPAPPKLLERICP